MFHVSGSYRVISMRRKRQFAVGGALCLLLLFAAIYLQAQNKDFLDGVVPASLVVYEMNTDDNAGKFNRLADALFPAQDRARVAPQETPTMLVGKVDNNTLEVYSSTGAWRWGDMER